MFFGASANTGIVAAINRSQAVIEFSLDGTVITANENFLAALGYSLDEIKGRHHSFFVEPKYAQSQDYRNFWQSLGAGKYQAGEYKRLGKGAREVWIQASYNPVFDRRGKPVKVVKFATDVTERKTADAIASGQIEAIGKSQAVIQFSLDGIVLDANANFLKTLGYTLAEIKGKHHRIFVEPDYAASSAYGEFWTRLKRGEYDAGQYKRLAKGGREVWIQASYNPILDSEDRPVMVVKYATDITAQKNADADAHGQIDAIGRSNAVIQFELDGTIIDANDNFLRAVGYDREEIVGQHHRLFVERDYAQSAAYRQFWEDLRAGKFQSAEYRRIGKGGREIWIQASYNPILDASGRPFKIVKYATDITQSMGARTEVARLVNESSMNVQGVASAAEEMSASVDEINTSMARSRAAVGDIVDQIGAAGSSSDKLKASSESMEKIANLIRDIAAKVNLLALNATIEAARAGEAGKGFTVVASEVKGLANQTAAATDSISQEIAEMLSISGLVADTIQKAVGSANSVSMHVGQVAAALEEQSVATREISGRVQQASHALDDITVQVKRIAAH